MSRPTQANVAQSDISNHVTQAISNRANYDLLTGSYNKIEPGTNARFAYHQPASAMDGSSHEQEDVTPLRAASRIQRQDPVDRMPPSRGKMWDPVKDCRHSNTTRAHLLSLLPAGHDRSDVFKDSTIDTMPSMDRHSYHGEHPYGQAQGSRQKFVCSGTGATAPLGILPSAQTNAITLGYQRSTSMNSQPFQVSHSYNETAAQPYHQSGMEPSKLAIQRSRQHQSGYGNNLSLPAHLRESSEQNENQAWESLTMRAASMGTQPPQAGYLHGLSNEIGQQFADMESGKPVSMGSNESCPDPSAFMSQALSMASNAERLDQQSNFKEAVRAYEQACALLQGVIIRSGSVEERMSCGHARNIYQARLDELLRELAASPSVTRRGKENEHEDDSMDRGKPQYTLLEDLALFNKDEEDLSWQEIAEIPIFKGKRKHRSLSQRKHTITKMGPRYREPETPWTEEEDTRLCAMGDAGKSLGDIHRKFRSRNGERCLKRYFHLRGHHTTSSNCTRASHQVRQAPARYAPSALNVYSSNIVAVVDPVSPCASASQSAPASSSNNPSLFVQRQSTSYMPSSSLSFASAEAASPPMITPSLNNAPSSGQSERQGRYSSTPSRQQRPPARSSSSQYSIGEALGYSVPSSPFENPSSSEAASTASSDWFFNSRRPRPSASFSSPSISHTNIFAGSITPSASATSPDAISPTLNETTNSGDSY